MLLSSEALLLLILSSKNIFLLEKFLSSAFWCSSSHQAKALLRSLILFLYFLLTWSLTGFRQETSPAWIENVESHIREKFRLDSNRRGGVHHWGDRPAALQYPADWTRSDVSNGNYSQEGKYSRETSVAVLQDWLETSGRQVGGLVGLGGEEGVGGSAGVRVAAHVGESCADNVRQWLYYLTLPLIMVCCPQTHEFCRISFTLCNIRSCIFATIWVTLSV